jgi:hypothetical protein
MALLGLAGCGGDDATGAVDAGSDEADAMQFDGSRADATVDAGAPDAAIAGDGGVASPPEPPTDFVLELGLGHRMFTAAAAGAEAPLQRGCQGAQHVWISLRSPDLQPGDLNNFLRAVRVRDGEEVVPRHSLILPWEGAADGAALIGVTLVIFDPVAVVGELVDIEVEVEAPDGRIGRAVIRVRVEWGPDAC